MIKPIAALLAALFYGLSCTNVTAFDGYDGEGTVEISLPRMVNSALLDSVSAEVNTEHVTYSNKYIAVNINKPVVKIENVSVQDKINDSLNKAIARFEESVASQSREDNKFNEENGLDIRQYVINVNNSVKYNKDGILSIVIELYSYMGGAHGMTMAVPFNFDLKTGNSGVLEDFFGNNTDYRGIILRFIKSKIAENPEMFFEEQVNKYNDVPYNQKFYLSDDAVVIIFDEYEIAPYAAGIVEFKVPYGAFPYGMRKEINIKEEAAGIFSFISKERGSINTYLNYPGVENLEDKNSEKMINEFLREEIDSFISSMTKRNSYEPGLKLKGITTYFTSLYKDKKTVFLSITYSASDECDSEILVKVKNYVIDLESGKIIAD